MDKLLYLILFIIGMALVVFGNKSIGPVGLSTMLAGIAVLIGLLWLYNRKYK